MVGMSTKISHWNPLKFLNDHNTDLHYAVLILNRPISIPRADMLSLWNRASLRITVDGGTDRWHNFVQDEGCALPEMITGDLDSASEEILNHYRKKGVAIIQTPDQNETDFTKALREAAAYVKRKELKLDGIVTVAQTSGRLDQIIGIMNTLFKAGDILNGVPVYVFAGNSITWLLGPGKHCIDLREYVDSLGKWCSLMPLGAPAHHVTTTGLKWNLVDQAMQFGGMVSTSNAYHGEPLVTVETDSYLLWSMSVGVDDDDDLYQK